MTVVDIQGALIGAVVSPLAMWAIYGVVKFCRWCAGITDDLRYCRSDVKGLEREARQLLEWHYDVARRLEKLEKPNA